MEEKMNARQIFGMSKEERARKVEFSFERIAVLTLTFTNAFCIFYLFAKVFLKF